MSHFVPAGAGREVKQLNKLFAYIYSAYGDLRYREEGQTMAEYGVILAVITAAILLALVFLSGQIQAVISRVGSAIK
jgi:Flp pilus assembly pilin Flp